MGYLDFEVRVARERAAVAGASGAYHVSVTRSPAREGAEATLTLPFGDMAGELRGLETAIVTSRAVSHQGQAATAGAAAPPEAAVRHFGTALFASLFTGQIASAYRRSLELAREHQGLRVRLRLDEVPELSALPWEFMYDPEDRDYICLSKQTPVVRYLKSDQAPDALMVQSPLCILAMIASPVDRASLDVQRERQLMEEATADLRASGRLRLDWVAGSTWSDLQRALRRGTCHVFHFIGHGGFDAATGVGVLAFTDDGGKTDLLDATEVGRLLADHGSLRLAVLNSCLGARASGSDAFSSTAAVLLARGVPAVVAMQYEITDRAALEFSKSLYEALADGLPVDAGVTDARKAVSLRFRDSFEWATPVLHMRSADGVLFRLEKGVPTPLTLAGPQPVAATSGTGAEGQSFPKGVTLLMVVAVALWAVFKFGCQ